MTNLRDVISYCRGVIEKYSLLIDKFLKADKLYDPDNPMDK